MSEADLIRDLVARDPRAQARPVEVDALFPPTHGRGRLHPRRRLSVRVDDDVATAVELMTAALGQEPPGARRPRHAWSASCSRSDVVQALAREDDVIAADIDQLLGDLGHQDWLVEVDEGVVDVSGPSGAAEHSVAHVVAHTVPGVLEVRVN